MMRKELRKWLPSEEEFQLLVIQLLVAGALAVLPGGEQLPIGWKEAELLVRLLLAVL